MKPIQQLSTQPGVLAVIYPCTTYRPLVEICDAEYRTTVETHLLLAEALIAGGDRG